jgi:F0F1-type ATP synthase delta subunit
MALALEKYASAFYEAAIASSGEKEELSRLSQNLWRLLKKHHRLGDWSLVLEIIKKKYETDPDFTVKAFLEYASGSPLAEVEKTLKAVYPDKEILIKAKENKDLIGGFKISFPDRLIDGSFRGALSRWRSSVDA